MMTTEPCELSTAADALGAVRKLQDALGHLPLDVQRDLKSLIDQCRKHLRAEDLFSQRALGDFQTLSEDLTRALDDRQDWCFVDGYEDEVYIRTPDGNLVAAALGPLDRMRAAAERTVDIIAASRVISRLA